MSVSPDENPAETAAPVLADALPLQGERVAFTGTLATMTHREAFEKVTLHGGVATQNVSRQTTMLVVGEEGWPLEADGEPSQKLLQALHWQQVEERVRIVREADWLHLLGLNDRQQDVRKEYTPAMLSRLLEVPVNRVRRWEKNGLLRAVRHVGRLPLFDYREVAGARRVVELLKAGVPEERLMKSMGSVRVHLPELAGSISQTPLVAQNERVYIKDENGLIDPDSRQRSFDFGTHESPQTSPESAEPDDEPGIVRMADAIASQHDQSQWTAADWFRQGCHLLEDNDPESAAEAFRLVLMDRPGEAEANFHLAEALYRSGNRPGALERYYAAVEGDHEYLEAWTQLGCLLAETGQQEAALDAFDAALNVHPEFPDAHWHKADVLWRMKRHADSQPHWQAYLNHDADSPWAETARQCLAEIDPGLRSTGEE